MFDDHAPLRPPSNWTGARLNGAATPPEHIASLDSPLSVRIPEPLLTEFKVLATRRHLKYKPAVIQAIKAWMRAHGAEVPDAPR